MMSMMFLLLLLGSAAFIIGVVVILLIGIWASVRSGQSEALAEAMAGKIDWKAIRDEELQSYLPDQKIAAIKRYRDLTGAGLAVAKSAIEYVIDHPDGAKKRTNRLQDIPEGAGVRDLILEGRIDEAVSVYGAFMGVDEFTARDAVQNMMDDDDSVTSEQRY